MEGNKVFILTSGLDQIASAVIMDFSWCKTHKNGIFEHDALFSS